MSEVKTKVNDRVRIVNYADGADIGNMENPNGITGTVISVGGFIDVRLDRSIIDGGGPVDCLLVFPGEIEILNAGS